jgi:hypothetical protein
MVIVENRGNKMITMVMNLVTDDNSYKFGRFEKSDTKCKADTRFSSFIVSEGGKQNAPVAQTEHETW